MSLTEQLLDAIDNSGVTLYRVAKDAGISYAIIERFTKRERGITLETADKLAAYFGMKLTKPRRVSPT
jgi:plasmid maintenance system antidote protein VapI